MEPAELQQTVSLQYAVRE